MSISLSIIDYTIIAAYFVLVFTIAKLVSNRETSEDYFLAGRNLGWFAIGASLFASNIGSEHLIGLAGSGAKGGVPVAQFEILAGMILLLLGWLFVPFYLKSGVTTMPEFLERRYGRSARNYLSFISVVSYVITKISATIFAGAIVFEAMGLSFWLGAGVTVISTGIYTVFGGLKAVIYTDAVQVIIMILGAIFVTILGLEHLGGIEQLQMTVPSDFFSMWRPHIDSEFPWTGIIFGAPILGVWYWCTDQFIVQRVLSAKNQTQARRGTIFAGYLKLLPLFIFVIPGIIAYALAQKGVINLSNPDHALPTLIATTLPTGIKGLVLAGLLAALMSSLSSVFNSCSTLITYDWYKIRNPDASEKRLTQVGQMATIALVVLGIAWIPLMKFVSGSLFTYIQSVQAYISPPIAAVFLWGLFAKKVNLRGAMASLVTGFVLGLMRLICEINKDSIPNFLQDLTAINFLHFALILFIICSSVLFIVSYATQGSKTADASELVISNKFKIDNLTDFILSIGVVVLTILCWVWFS